jgi:CrcB protein
MIKSLTLVGIGGAIGSILRYVSSLIINKYFSGSFPLATFIVNMTGCLLIGFLIGYFYKHPQDHLKLLLITGLCGGFTTFSTFSAENLTLFQNGLTINALLYILLSVVIGVSLVWLGSVLGK